MSGRSVPTHGLDTHGRLVAEEINELSGAKGKPTKRALRVEDLVKLGLIRVDSSGNVAMPEVPPGGKIYTEAEAAALADNQNTLTQLQQEAQARAQEVADLQQKIQLANNQNSQLAEVIAAEKQRSSDLAARIANNETLGEKLRQNTEQVNQSINAVLEGVGSVDAVPHGATYGRPANADLVDYDAGSGAVRRIGLRVPGGQRIADQRNLPQSNTTSFGAVRTTTAISADSSGNVSINAHEVKYGAVTISYSAVVNAITGLTVGSTYVIYCYDEAYQGGVRTWFAGINPVGVMDLGDGVVVVGQITIPASGSSSGGTGGGGSDPEEWCVDYDAVLPDGRLVRELRLGDLVECIDVRTGETGMFPLLGMGFGEEICYAMVTPELAEVRQSKSTKMDLPDGRVLATPEMLGREVYANIDGEVKRTFVCDLYCLGMRRVCKPDLGDRMFFAGTKARATIATHNMRYKP